MNINKKYAVNSIISVGIYVLALKIHVFMHYFSSKPSKTSHLNHKNSDKRARFSDKWSHGGGAPPPAPIDFGPAREALHSFKKVYEVILEERNFYGFFVEFLEKHMDFSQGCVRDFWM